MAFPPISLADIVLHLTWICLCVQGLRNHALFLTYFFDLTIVADTFTAASVVFCPELFEVIQGNAFPALDFFLTSRWRCYDHRGDTLPMLVEKAFHEGYEIAHKGLLVWAAIPATANVPRFRLLFVAMEAAFTFYSGP